MTAHALPHVKPAHKKHQAKAYYPHATAARCLIAAIVGLAIACLAALCLAGPSDQRRANGPQDPAPPAAWAITDHKHDSHQADPSAAAVCENGNCNAAGRREGRRPLLNAADRGGRFLSRLRGRCGRGCN